MNGEFAEAGDGGAEGGVKNLAGKGKEVHVDCAGEAEPREACKWAENLANIGGSGEGKEAHDGVIAAAGGADEADECAHGGADDVAGFDVEFVEDIKEAEMGKAAAAATAEHESDVFVVDFFIQIFD